MPFRKLFLSRWSALIWAGGILWTVFDVVGVGPAKTEAVASANTQAVDATGVNVDTADLAILANVMHGQ